jgi:hypothetical protein
MLHTAVEIALLFTSVLVFPFVTTAASESARNAKSIKKRKPESLLFAISAFFCGYFFSQSALVQVSVLPISEIPM